MDRRWSFLVYLATGRPMKIVLVNEGGPRQLTRGAARGGRAGYAIFWFNIEASCLELS